MRLRSCLDLIIAVFAATFAATPAQSRDGWAEHPVCDPALFGEGSPALIKCHDWIRKVRRHDNGNSCCGDGDAFVVDRSFHDAAGNFYIVVQGKTYLLPPERMNDASTDGGPNQTGEEIAFIWSGEAVCYFAGTLT